MKTLLKILRNILIVIVALVVIVYGIRFYNHKQTEKLSKISEDMPQGKFYTPEQLKDVSKLDIPGVAVSEIKGENLVGYHLLPNEIMHKGTVVTFGGSEGSSNFSEAVAIAEKGYEVYSMYFFNAEGLPSELLKIPLENFEEILKEVEKTAKEPRPITLYGGSKGSEYILELSTRYPDKIDNIVLYAPSAYRYQGLSFSEREPHSSWTWNGEEVPFLSLQVVEPKILGKMLLDMVLGKPAHYTPTYLSAIERAKNKEEARIPVENSKAKALIFAGGDDQVWPSALMTDTIKEKYGGDIEVKVFEKAGHIFFGPPIIQNMFMGGEYEANVEAKVESDRILFEKLNEWMPGN